MIYITVTRTTKAKVRDPINLLSPSSRITKPVAKRKNAMWMRTGRLWIITLRCHCVMLIQIKWWWRRDTVVISSRPRTVMPPYPPYPVLSFVGYYVTLPLNSYLRHYVNLVVVVPHLSAFTFTEV
jgi:hypothetical protein